MSKHGQHDTKKAFITKQKRQQKNREIHYGSLFFKVWILEQIWKKNNNSKKGKQVKDKEHVICQPEARNEMEKKNYIHTIVPWN